MVLESNVNVNSMCICTPVLGFSDVAYSNTTGKQTLGINCRGGTGIWSTARNVGPAMHMVKPNETSRFVGSLHSSNEISTVNL